MTSLEQKIDSVVYHAIATRLEALQQRLLQIKQKMNARGLLNSSVTVTESCNACVEELAESTKTIFDEIVRVHELDGAKYSRKLNHILVARFNTHLEWLVSRLNEIQSISIDTIATGLSMDIQRSIDGINLKRVELAALYSAEIELYVDSVRSKPENKFLSRITQRLLDIKLVVLVLAVAAAAIWTVDFADAIQTISE